MSAMYMSVQEGCEGKRKVFAIFYKSIKSCYINEIHSNFLAISSNYFKATNFSSYLVFKGKISQRDSNSLKNKLKKFLFLEALKKS